jgi:uncharacterized membrane protein
MAAYLRIALAVPLVLVLPGYAITMAVFATRPLDHAATILFSIALSLTAAVLGGFVLNLTPEGLRTGSWTILLITMTLGAGVVALARRRALVIVKEVYPRDWGGRLPLRRWDSVFFGLALVLVAGAFHIAVTGADTQPATGFTQLWLLPSDDGSSNVVRVGLRNGEAGVTSYRLQLITRGVVIAEWPEVELQPHQTWEDIATLPANRTDGTTVEALLYRNDAPGVIYRRAQLWRR